ncbi:MAG TPA: hypothetical protein VGO87_14615 [Acidimicrobiia bacterium]|jgi:hypothetical protein
MKVAVECPGCGAGVEIEPGGRSASLFCSRCDYPLFWVRPPHLDDELVDLSDSVLRRRPGASGIRLPATVPCPACAELNVVVAVVCIRCNSPMQPIPEPEPEPEPEVVVELPPAPGPDRGLWWLPWMAALIAVLGVAFVGGMLTWILEH